jgi:hypothetical protein
MTPFPPECSLPEFVKVQTVFHKLNAYDLQMRAQVNKLGPFVNKLKAYHLRMKRVVNKPGP